MAQRGIYSELKPAWWYAKEGKLPDAPKQVQLIISDLCNQDCHFCAYRMSNYTSNELFVGDSPKSKYGHNNPTRFIPVERCLTLLEEFKEAGVLSVQFTGGGEPTVHPNHEAIFEKCLSLGLRAALVTNGVRLTKGCTKELLPRFDWVRISVDAGNRDSYAAIRRTSGFHWDKIWENIVTLVHVIKTQPPTVSPIGRYPDRVLEGTTLGLGFVVSPQSWPEIPEFIEKAKASGVQNARLTAMFSTEDEAPFEDIYEQIVSLIEAARREYETDSFVIYDNFGSRFEDLKQHSPDYSFCGYQFFTTYVGGDLNLYRCCVQSYNRRGLLGSLKERSFAEFWKQGVRETNMKTFDARGCERCQFNAKNRALNYLMDDPAHKEWP